MQKAKAVFLEWQPALKLAVLIALIQRVFFQVWMGGVFAAIENFQLDTGYHYTPADKRLPFLESDLSRVLFEIWRRWDAVHYLNLAENGYEATDPKPTIFPPLTSVGIQFFDMVTPGIVDIGGIFFSSLYFIIFLTVFYRFCEIYYQDQPLAVASVWVIAFLPTSYVWNAPMSEAPYMALTIALLYMTLHNQWIIATFLGILATLTRQQGMVLGGVALLMLLEQSKATYGIWVDNGWRIFKKVWPFVLLPLVWYAFLSYRESIHLPPYQSTQEQYFGTLFVNPLQGILDTAELFIRFPTKTLAYPDLIAVLVTWVLAIALLLSPRHRRLPLIGYTFGYMLIFFTLGLKVGEGTLLKISYARQAMALFPLWVLVADALLHSSKWVRLLYVAFIFAALLILSAAHSLGGGVS